jgi:hypothetical protein
MEGSGATGWAADVARQIWRDWEQVELRVGCEVVQRVEVGYQCCGVTEAQITF